jgi:hypothetical protein
MFTPSDIGARMAVQDNLATADPIFYVQQRERIYGVSSDYTDTFVWLDDEGECDEGKGMRVGYVETWSNVQPFFTRGAAQNYIERYGYNLRSPRIYVGSAYRNEEWKEARAMFVAAAKQGASS